MKLNADPVEETISLNEGMAPSRPVLALAPTGARAALADVADRTGPELAKQWLLVTQCKSDRVVYYTDDQDFDIPADADWCYVSPYHGDLPDGMTLRNCWSWRYRGMAFIDARRAPAERGGQALLEHNKVSLRKLLADKIDAWRKPFAPSSLLGAEARRAKLAEAEQLTRDDGDPSALRFLAGAAAARGLTIGEMAALVIARDRACREMLETTELLREEIGAAIERATGQEALSEIRARLLGDSLSPQLDVGRAVVPDHTTPAQMQRRPRAGELAQEQLRLRIKLQMKINDLRRSQASGYLLDEETMKLKATIARKVLRSGGAVPPGLDASVLISHAAARGQTLTAAAEESVRDIDELASVLLDTEKMKDAVLSRLATLATFDDIAAMATAIDTLSLDRQRGAAKP